MEAASCVGTWTRVEEITPKRPVTRIGELFWLPKPCLSKRKSLSVVDSTFDEILRRTPCRGAQVLYLCVGKALKHFSCGLSILHFKVFSLIYV